MAQVVEAKVRNASAVNGRMPRRGDVHREHAGCKAVPYAIDEATMLFGV
jgi:hypothetical protein